MNYYLSVDIGASSGRLILSHLEKGKILLEEIHRFENGMEKQDGHLTWNTEKLFAEIISGMKKCSVLGKIPKSIGIDTWAVDYVLLDQAGNKLLPAYGYRDKRTEGMDLKVYEIIDEASLYARTGIQKQLFNTIYQLMATKTENPELMEQAASMLLIPDYLHYLLCGVKATEYTNASTTQLLNPKTKDWDYELIDMLGYKRELFGRICLPGERLGGLTKEIEKAVGFQCDVVAPATHDTGAAVMAVPCEAAPCEAASCEAPLSEAVACASVPYALDSSTVTPVTAAPHQKENTLYISSGTWSLMGTELKEAICTEKSRRCNFTNEGGYGYRFRFLKNIMGLWMINSVRKEIAPKMSFGEICEGAARQSIESIVDANSDCFLAPDNMTEAVKKACAESNQQIPEGIYELAAVIYNSLARCYAKTVDEIESITDKHFDCIHIIGGGANADYLNQLTAKACRRKVVAGPIEATAIGNAVAQMIAAGELKGLDEARQCVYQSFDMKVYEA